MKANKLFHKLFCLSISFHLVFSSTIVANDVWTESKKYVEQTNKIASELAETKFNGMVSSYFEEIAKFNFKDKNMVLLNDMNFELDSLIRQFDKYSSYTEKELNLNQLRELREKIRVFLKKVNVFFDELSEVALQSTLSVTDIQAFINAQFSYIQFMCKEGWQPSTLDLCKLPVKEVYAPDFNFYMSLTTSEHGQGAVGYYNTSMSEHDRQYFAGGATAATALTYGYLVSGTSYSLIGGSAAGINFGAAALAAAYVAVAVLVIAAVIHVTEKNKYYRETQKIVNAQYFTFQSKATPETVSQFLLKICGENKDIMDKISNLTSDIRQSKFSSEEIISDYKNVKHEIAQFSRLQYNYNKRWTEIAKEKGVYKRIGELRGSQKPQNKDANYVKCAEPTVNEKELEDLEEKVSDEVVKTIEYKRFNEIQASWNKNKKLEMLYYALRASLFSSIEWENSVRGIAKKATNRVSPIMLRTLNKRVSELIKLKKEPKTPNFFKNSALSLEKYTFKLFKAILWKGIGSVEYEGVKRQIEDEQNQFVKSNERESLNSSQREMLDKYWADLLAI